MAGKKKISRLIVFQLENMTGGRLKRKKGHRVKGGWGKGATPREKGGAWKVNSTGLWRWRGPAG